MRQTALAQPPRVARRRQRNVRNRPASTSRRHFYFRNPKPPVVRASKKFQRFMVKTGGLDALDVLNHVKMDGTKPDIVCYTTVLDGVIAKDDYAKADQVFVEMLVLGLVA